MFMRAPILFTSYRRPMVSVTQVTIHTVVLTLWLGRISSSPRSLCSIIVCASSSTLLTTVAVGNTSLIWLAPVPAYMTILATSPCVAELGGIAENLGTSSSTCNKFTISLMSSDNGSRINYRLAVMRKICCFEICRSRDVKNQGSDVHFQTLRCGPR